MTTRQEETIKVRIGKSVVRKGSLEVARQGPGSAKIGAREEGSRGPGARLSFERRRRETGGPGNRTRKPYRRREASILVRQHVEGVELSRKA